MNLTPIQLRDLEQHLAFEQASGMIDGMTAPAPVDKFNDLIWHDLSDADCDLSAEVAYLDSRGLIDRHADDANWIQIREEHNPLPVAEQAVQA